MIALSGCESGATGPTSKFRVSRDFMDCVIKEYEAALIGPCTEEVLDMWIVQNEP